MPRPRTLQDLKQYCRGCYQDRYNYPGTCERPGIDAIVTSKNCWSLSLDNLVYCRQEKAYAMSCHSGSHQQWLVQYAKTRKKPEWNRWR